MTMSDDTSDKGANRKVPVAWEALEDAFENNAPEVHSYLNVDSGDVIRVVDGVADPAMHARITQDPMYMLVDPVSSREQYRWMERYITIIDEPELRQKLVSAIDGKGAFRRFKDVLMNQPVERERWFTFRSERLRTAMETWLSAHGIEAVERKKWEVPSADASAATAGAAPVTTDAAAAPVDDGVKSAAPTAPTAQDGAEEATRARLAKLVASLPGRELEMAVDFLEYLRERRPLSRARAKDPGSGSDPGTDADGA